MKKTIVLAMALFLLAAGSAYAKETLYLKDLDTNLMWAGTYVGPIGGYLNGSSQETYFVCDDYEATTSIPSTFSVKTTTVTDLKGVRFANDPDAATNYKMAAYLLTQMLSFKTADTIGPIQFAIWQIFAPDASYKLTFDQQAQVDAWLKAAQANYGSYTYSSVLVLTPSGTKNQEFLSGKAAPVPLPRSLLLFAPALFGLFVLRRTVKRGTVVPVS
jgi:hypothetical protein